MVFLLYKRVTFNNLIIVVLLHALYVCACAFWTGTTCSDSLHALVVCPQCESQLLEITWSAAQLTLPPCAECPAPPLSVLLLHHVAPVIS